MIPCAKWPFKQKEKKKKKGAGGHWWKMCFHTEEVCHLLIVRKVLNKKDLRAAESCFFQRGRVGLLFSRKAGQDSAREVCYYLKLLWGFFQGENEVVDYLWKKRNGQVNWQIAAAGRVLQLQGTSILKQY